MYSAYRSFAAAVIAAVAIAASPVRMPAQADAGVTSGKLHVCADPKNLPFSNVEQQGFEKVDYELLMGGVCALYVGTRT